MAVHKGRWECPDQWSEWSEWLSSGLHARNRWRLPVLLSGILFAQGRRTVTTWLRAAGVSDDFQDYYYFLAALGRKSESVASRLLVLVLIVLPLPKRLLAVIDDSPTKRYGPKVEGADIHHNPTPDPADSAYLYRHIWVTLSLVLRHPTWRSQRLRPIQFLYRVFALKVAKRNSESCTIGGSISSLSWRFAAVPSKQCGVFSEICCPAGPPTAQSSIRNSTHLWRGNEASLWRFNQSKYQVCVFSCHVSCGYGNDN